MKTSEKIMFEIYRDAGEPPSYRVVYFTELDEHRRDVEIARAMAGDHVFDGFLPEDNPQAKARVDDVIDQLNRGTELDDVGIAHALDGYLV
jgi:hypothetical protein